MKKQTGSFLYQFTCFFLLLNLILVDQLNAQQKLKQPATLLWRISGNGLTKPSYLYGTMHLTDKRLFYFGDSLYHAMEQTDGFAIEIDPNELSTQLIQSFTKEDNTVLLKDEVDQESYEKISKTLSKKYGFKSERLTKRQAYLARNEWMKEMQKPDDMNTFMDAWLFNIARQMGKWTGGIEDLQDQLSLIEKDEANFSFEDLLINKKLMQGGLNQMIDLYLSQDLEAIDVFFNQNAQHQKDEWLTKRNIKMAHRMDSLLQFRTHFFAIGAAHLPGDSGVIRLLLQKGFKVEPVFSSHKISPEDYHIQGKELPWKSFVPTDSMYSVRFPSPSSTMFISGNVLKMQMCIDIPTSTYYITTAVPNMRPELSKEKLVEEMIKVFTKEGKLLEKKKINEPGIIGLDVLVAKDGFLRMRGFIKGNYVFMSVMGHESKKEMILGEMAEKFFSSFSASDKSLVVSSQMKTYTNEIDGFSVLLPQMPEQQKTETGVEGWISKTYSSLDLSNNVYYMMLVRSTAPGYYLNGDSNYFELQKQNWKPLLTEVTAEKHFFLGEFPAMEYNFTMKKGKEKARCKSITINRGNRSYLLLAITEKNPDEIPSVEIFFNSFQLIEYKKANWSTQVSPDQHYSTYAPAPVTIRMKKDENGKETGSYSYVSYDSLNAVSYELSKINFVDYYHAENDSIAFHDVLSTQIEATDSVISSRFTKNGNDLSQDVVAWIKGNQNVRRMRLILHNDTMYIGFALLQPSLLNLPEVNKHFDELSVLTQFTGNTIFKKKTKELLIDLGAGDSTRFVNAAERITKINFGKEDLPALKEALMKQYDFADDNHSEIYNQIATIIADLNDSSIVSFVRKKYYSPNIDNEAQKIAMLRILALTKTKESYAALKDLLLTDPPVVEYFYPLNSVITDSLELVIPLFPEILQLTKDTLYSDFVTGLANHLLDSNRIQVTMIMPFEQDLINIAQLFKEKLAAHPDTYVYMADEYLHLLARLNSKKGNQLLQEIVLLKQKSLNSFLVLDLLNNHQKVPQEIIESQAADNEFRYSFYYRLQEKGFEGIFPAKYKSQKSIAESDVYNMASEDEEVESIIFLDDKLYEYKGETKRYYLFKVKVGENWHLGISGGFEKDAKILMIKQGNDIGGVYWEEEFNPKKLKEQFEAYMNGLEEE